MKRHFTARIGMFLFTFFIALELEGDELFLVVQWKSLKCGYGALR